MSLNFYTMDVGTFPTIKYVTPDFCNYKVQDPAVIAAERQTIAYYAVNRPSFAKLTPYTIRTNLPVTKYYHENGCISFTKTEITRVT